ncbi:iron-sulfur cluster co-chaperone HscB C-terminal domain-containing protein, partial [Burkholderia multivorans]|uniref:iron-sulfur cluster co-chaperone HscB C-terminal domain-containing protein n=1 Tax=Burkholderia multivorans TaxID=87883 RepID=UPI00283AB130
RGVDIGAENNTAMEPAFLMQQMEWRESIEDAAQRQQIGRALERIAQRPVRFVRARRPLHRDALLRVAGRGE